MQLNLQTYFQRLRMPYQIILVTFLPLLFFGLLSVIVGMYALYRIPRDLILERHAALTQVAATKVADSLSEHLSLLGTVSREIAPFIDDASAQQHILNEYADLLNNFDGGVSVLNVEGIVLAATPAPAASLGGNFAHRAYFQRVKTRRTTVFSTVFEDELLDVDAVLIAVPIWDNAGAFTGALAGEFFLHRQSWAYELLPLHQQAATRQVSLVGSEGTLIYHPDDERIGQDLRAVPELWQLIISGQSHSVVYTSPDSSTPVVAAYAPISGTPWGLLMEESLHILLAPIVPYQWAAGGLLLLGLLGAVLALFRSVQRVTQPLNTLTGEAQRAAEGAHFRPLPPTGPPDLRALITMINQMVARLEAQQTALRNYAREVLRSQEAERQRISRDLHDETVQDLVGLAQRIELCRQPLREGATQDVETRLAELHTLARDALADARRMSHHLRPRMLEDLGLAVAVQSLCDELAAQQPEARVHCELVGTPIRLPDELELTAFRVVQEALTNVHKHAGNATRVNVTLFFENWGVLALMEDNGPGFIPTATDALISAGHLGLAGMRERAQLFGGKLEITSGLGKGTRIELRLETENYPPTPY